MAQHILIVDDDTGILSALTMLMKSEGFKPVCVTNPDDALLQLRDKDFQLVLMDLNYSLDTTSGEEGMQLISDIRQLDDVLPIVVMTGWGTVDVAVSAMKKGANDFIQKPWENDRLLTILNNQTQLASSRRHSQKLSTHNKLLRDEVNPADGIIAESPAMKQVLATIRRVAESDVNVLLTGENGTGKSLLARYLHDLSSRRQSAQVSVNMGAVTEALFESEMFGHVKGAFTDAKETRIGRFELADEGTLFLDEIANTPYSQQGKLLRVLEDSQFEKVGSSKTQTVDIRLITATNADLQQAVDEGAFRKDLLYRINTIEIEMPPLHKRPEDIIPLAKAFLRRVADKYGQAAVSISEAAQKTLMAYHWPGNVRELSHVMERAQILCLDADIKPQDLRLNENGDAEAGSKTASGASDLHSLADIEASAITGRLVHFDGDAVKAAQSLGLSRSAFYRKLQKINEPDN